MSLDDIRNSLKSGLQAARRNGPRESAREIVNGCLDLIGALREADVPWRTITEMINVGRGAEDAIKMMTVKTYYFQMVKVPQVAGSSAQTAAKSAASVVRPKAAVASAQTVDPSIDVGGRVAADPETCVTTASERKSEGVSKTEDDSARDASARTPVESKRASIKESPRDDVRPSAELKTGTTGGKRVGFEALVGT